MSAPRSPIHAYGRLQRNGQAAGRHRPHHRRLHQAEKGWGAELFWALSVSRREDAVVFSACHAPVLSLLRLRRVRRRLQLRAEDRKHQLPRSPPAGGPEAGHPSAQGDVFEPGGSEGSQAARPVARHSGTRRRVFPGMPKAPRRSARPRVSARAWSGCRNHRTLPHRLRARFRLPPPRPPGQRVQRRSAARERSVFVEAGGQPSARTRAMPPEQSRSSRPTTERPNGQRRFIPSSATA